MKQQLRSSNRRLGIKGSVALSSLYGTPRCDGLHKLQEIHVIVKPGYGIEFAYVILSYGIVLKLDDPSPGDSESKSNLTRTSRNVSAELECYWPLSKIAGFTTRVRSPASENDSAFWLHVNNNINYGAIIPKIVKSHDETRGGDEEEVKTKKGCTCGRKIEKGAINAYRGIVKRVNTELGRLALKPDLQVSNPLLLLLLSILESEAAAVAGDAGRRHFDIASREAVYNSIEWRLGLDEAEE
ncbi:hypothetical protein Tco_0009489 [Tanacetum coccineum]